MLAKLICFSQKMLPPELSENNYLFTGHFTIMSNLLDIHFVIKVNAKKSPRFDLSEVIFECDKNENDVGEVGTS